MFKNTAKIVSSLIAIVAVVLIWPVYEFFAYKNKVAFPPFYQFIDIPINSPSTQEVHPHYTESAKDALELLSSHKTSINAPAISAAVAIDGEVVWSAAVGWADIETKKPATTHTRFRIGSTSKALTATALARMVDANIIGLDRPISTYMPDIPNPNWKVITTRQLVSHMAGLPHYKENSDLMGLYRTMLLSTRYEDVEDAITVFDDSEMLFEPGAQFYYSSFGTVLMSAIMQRAAKTPYLDVMQQEVFTPLNMTSTMAEFIDDKDDNLATFYWNNEGRTKHVRKWRDVDLSHRLAGGGFVSTSSDLVRLGSAYLNDRFLSTGVRDTFWTPQTLPDGSETPNGYALGWRVFKKKIDETFPPTTVANHGGVSRGAQSWLMVLPEYNMSVAININANTDVFWDFGSVSMPLAKMFIIANQHNNKGKVTAE